MGYAPGEASELLMGIMEIAASMMMHAYTRRKMRELPPEEQSAGFPLFLTAGGIFLLGLGSLITFVGAFVREVFGIVDPYQLWTFNVLFYLFLSLGALVMSYASSIIVEKKKVIYVLVPLFILIFLILITGPVMNLSLGLTEFIASYPARILFVIPLVMWMYLAKQTRTSTSISVAYLALTVPTFTMFLYVPEGAPIMFVIFIRLFGPAFVGINFYMGAREVSGEMVLYALSYAFTGLWMTFMVISGVTGLEEALRLVTVGLVGLISFGSGAYTYARWRETKAPATLSLSFFFNISGIGFILIAMRSLGVVPAVEFLYIPVIFGVVGSMFMGLSAFIALDWRRVMLLPVLVAAPTIIMLLSWFPSDPRSYDLYRPMLMVTNIINLTVPIFLYLYLWWKMKQVGRPNRMRPLSLSLSLILTTAANVGGRISELPFAYIELLAIFIAWLGITGRLDRWLSMGDK